MALEDPYGYLVETAIQDIWSSKVELEVIDE